MPADWACTDPDGAVGHRQSPMTVSTTPRGRPDRHGHAARGRADPEVVHGDLSRTRPGTSPRRPCTYTVADQNPPVAAITSPIDGARFTLGKVVNAAWTCTDPDGPQDIDQNASFGTLPVGDAIDTASAGTKLFSVHCQDLAGNVGDKQVSYVVDDSPPIVTIATPIDGGTYPRGSNQPAAWGCTDADGDADIKTKVGTVARRARRSTPARSGSRRFTVTCTDQAGNVGTKTVSYTVIGGPPTVTIAVSDRREDVRIGSGHPADVFVRRPPTTTSSPAFVRAEAARSTRRRAGRSRSR